MREAVVDLEGLRGARIEGAFEYGSDVLLLLDGNRFCCLRASYDIDIFIDDLAWCDFLESHLAELDRVMAEAEEEVGRS
jgi:hypothetical protein